MTQDVQKTMQYLQRENIRLKAENSSLKELLTRLQKSVQALSSLQQKIDNIRPESDVYRLINDILNAALVAVDSENGSLLLEDEESNELVFVEVIGNAREMLMGYRLQKGVGVAGWAVEHRKAKLVEDVRREPTFSPLVDQVTGMQTSSLICVPLYDENRSLGAIEVVNTRTGRPFNDSDKDLLLLVARLASVAIVAAERTHPT